MCAFFLGMIDCLKKEAIPTLNLPGDIESRRMANYGITYRWDEAKKVCFFAFLFRFLSFVV